jgi:hypothetical protein
VFRIGGRGGVGGSNWPGNLCEVVAYDKELSLAELQAIYNAGVPPDQRRLATVADLVGYWKMGQQPL